MELQLFDGRLAGVGHDLERFGILALVNFDLRALIPDCCAKQALSPPLLVLWLQCQLLKSSGLQVGDGLASPGLRAGTRPSKTRHGHLSHV